MRRTATALATVLLTAALVGCSSARSHNVGNGKSSGTITPPAIPSSPPAPASDGTGVQLPLDAYSATSDQDTEVLRRANEILVQRCMAQQGFTYTIAPQTSPSSAAQPLPVQPYGITDLTTARQFGYGHGGNLANRQNSGSLASIPDIGQLIAQHGSAWVIAMFGAIPPNTPPQGKPRGCTDSGSASLYDSAYGHIDRNIVGELADQALQRTQSDSRVIAVEAKWSSCMAAHGFKFDTPMQAAQQQWPIPASAAELATATSDIECKKQTNLAGVWLAVETGYQQQLVDQNSVTLNEFHSDLLRLIQLAERIVGSPISSPAH